jgi:hypothetical protein
MVRRSVGGVNRVDACKAIDDCSLRIRGAVTPDDSFGRSGTNHRAQSGAKRSMGRPTSMLRSFSAALVAFLLLAGRSALADVIEPRHVRVIDGDTITMNGKTIHLVGFVVPETRDAQCKAEREQPRWVSGFAISAAPAALSKRTAGTLATFWSKKGWRSLTRVAAADAPRRRSFGANRHGESNHAGRHQGRPCAPRSGEVREYCRLCTEPNAPTSTIIQP